MDTVLLVIRSGQTTAAHVRRARNLLQSANAGVLGLVVNAADLGSPDYYYYHYEAKYRSYSGKEENERNSTLNDNQDLDNIADQRER
jgi:Mrp family chromosome partitioning ATPase